MRTLKNQNSKADSKLGNCSGDDALKSAMRNLRKTRQPRQEAPVGKSGPKAIPKIKPKIKAKPVPAQWPLTSEIVDPTDVEGKLGGEIDVKTEFTPKELTFLRLHLLEGLDQISAMKSSGYRSSQDKYLQYVAKKILIKYESRTEDHRKIFRDIGLGEVAIARGIHKLATEAKSEMVRLQALALAAKCLGMTKEIQEGVQGVKIVINAANGESLKVGVCVPPREDVLPDPTITK